MLEKEKIEDYLEIVKDIKKSHVLIDMHVHPFNVVSDDLQYNQNPKYEGLFSSSTPDYVVPTIKKLKISCQKNRIDQKNSSDLNAKMALLTARRLYNHTGAKVFSDQMDLSGIDKILLLPVKSSIESDDSQMRLLKKYFSNDEKFVFGYCVSNDIPNQDITEVIGDAVKKYGVKAVKIHPNITDIDLSLKAGVKKIEHILEGSSVADLNVIIHGGKSSHLGSSQAAQHSVLDKLRDIDWGITKHAVVIAHAGTYGHDIEQTTAEILPAINKLLSKYNNIYVDMSGLSFDKITAIIKNIDLDRVLFGSDSLYSSQWGAVVKLLHALKLSVTDYEEKFLKIVSTTPGRIFCI